MSKNKDLYDFCRCNKPIWVKRILDSSKDINVLYQEGTFFRFAIKDNNVETCSALLTYFEEKQFPNKDDKYLEARDQLQEVLENAICEREIPKEMKQVLSPYLNFEDSDSDIANLSDVSVESLDIKEKSTPSENLLTEDNLRIFNQEFTSQDAHEESKLTGDLQESDIT